MRVITRAQIDDCYEAVEQARWILRTTHTVENRANFTRVLASECGRRVPARIMAQLFKSEAK